MTNPQSTRDEDLILDGVAAITDLGLTQRTRVITEPLGWEGVLLNMTTDRDFKVQVYAHVELPLVGAHTFGVKGDQRVSLSITEPNPGFGWEGKPAPQATVNMSRSEALRLHSRLGALLDATSPY